MELLAVKCPECGSNRLYRDGIRYLKDSSTVQRWLCRNCGFRFSDTTSKLNVKVNIPGQILKTSKSPNDLTHNVISDLSLPLKESVNGFPFLNGEYVTSHKGSIVEQDLNRLRNYNRTRQICASNKEAKP